MNTQEPDPRRGNLELRWVCDDPEAIGPCIGLLEHDSVARGIQALDRMVKAAEVEVVLATHVEPGKWLTLVTGEVEDVLASLREAEEETMDAVVDTLFLPNLHDAILPAIAGRTFEGDMDALGILETFTVASAIVAADRACKTSVVDLVDLRLANGLGGKSYFTLAGAPAEVRAALAAGADHAREKNLLVKEVVIPQLDPRVQDLLR